MILLHQVHALAPGAGPEFEEVDRATICYP